MSPWTKVVRAMRERPTTTATVLAVRAAVIAGMPIHHGSPFARWCARTDVQHAVNRVLPTPPQDQDQHVKMYRYAHPTTAV